MPTTQHIRPATLIASLEEHATSLGATPEQEIMAQGLLLIAHFLEALAADVADIARDLNQLKDEHWRNA